MSEATPDEITTAADAPPGDVYSPELRRGGWRMMFRATRHAGKWIPIGLSVAVVWVAAKIVIPLAAAAAIDDGFDPYDASVIIKWCVVILVLSAIAAVCASVRWYSAFYCGHRAEHVLRSELFAHLQQLHFGYHDRAEIGNLMARANLDLRQINNLVVFTPVLVANFVMVIGILAVLFTIDVKLTLVSIISFPLLVVAAVWFQKLLTPVATRLQERLARVSTVVEEGVAGVRVVKGLGAEQVEIDRLVGGADAVQREAMRLGRLRSNFNPLLDLLPMLALVTVLYVGGNDVIGGSLTIGDLVAFSALLLQLVFPLRMTSYIVAQVARASASAARVQEVMVAEPEITEDESSPELTPGPGAVSFRGVRFSYHGGRDVLRAFDLELAGGESVALVGPTGCGKSTVARLIPRFYDVDDGAVAIDGCDVRDIRLGSLRREIGLVFEETFLFSDTVWENLAFAAREGSDHVDRDEVERAARLAGADDFIRALPDGYETLLGEHGFSLSGGQRQRLAIARAILANPRVLILDDATSAVDPTKEHEIRAALGGGDARAHHVDHRPSPRDHRARRPGGADGRRRCGRRDRDPRAPARDQLGLSPRAGRHLRSNTTPTMMRRW